jgi:hypothetical protein
MGVIKSPNLFALSLFIFSLTWSFFFSPLHASAEKLLFDVSWSGMKVGEASLNIDESVNEVRLTGRGETAGWVSIFYKISDTLVSRLNKADFESAKDGLLYSFNYRKTLREGKLKLDEELTIDKSEPEALLVDHLKNTSVRIPLQGGVQGWVRKEPVYDPLSLLIHIRRLPLTVGSSTPFKFADRSDTYEVQVRVLRKETVTTPLGTFNTLVLNPLFGYIPGDRGLMYIKGDAYIWVTDDEKRLPVQILKNADVPVPGIIPKFMREGMKRAKMTLRKVE